jgi:hypothetical protein
VYYIDQDTMIRAPEGYDFTWRHVESVDPALKSALGLTIWAEDPSTSFWYCIRAEYLRGIFIPAKLVEAVQDRTKQYNIIRRISDPHEVWYIQTAAHMGVSPQYMGVYNKSGRKGELIKGLQEKLGTRLYIAPWCEDFIAELQECRWSETSDNKIVNQHVYHLADSAQYFADNIPSPGARPISIPVHQHIYMENEKRKLNLEKKKSEMVRMRRRAW